MARYPGSTPGLPARQAALKLLDAVLRRGEPLEAALPNAARGLEGPDRALVHAIVGHALRRLPDLDALIDAATLKPLPLDAKARFALRIALIQALVLKTPPHAAIATVLPLVEGGPRRLVHGVFGTLMRGEVALPEPPTLPAETEVRWRTVWGDRVVEAARRAIASPPPLDLTFAGPVDDSLGGVSLVPSHLRLVEAGPVEAIAGYREGRWWVQDLAASLPARLLGPGDGRLALDLCAAPGGKALQLAAQSWQVTGLDKSAKRLARLTDNSTRTGLAVELVQADALDWQPDAPVAAILLDAPCTSTGIFRRHPDVLHRIGARHIEEMAELQSRLLGRALGWLAPGGTLVYATCSLEPEEGEQRIETALADRGDVTIDTVSPNELPRGIASHERGWVRTLPGMLEAEGGLDGFFIARLTRRA